MSPTINDSICSRPRLVSLAFQPAESTVAGVVSIQSYRGELAARRPKTLWSSQFPGAVNTRKIKTHMQILDSEARYYRYDVNSRGVDNDHRVCLNGNPGGAFPKLWLKTTVKKFGTTAYSKVWKFLGVFSQAFPLKFWEFSRFWKMFGPFRLTPWGYSTGAHRIKLRS